MVENVDARHEVLRDAWSEGATAREVRFVSLDEDALHYELHGGQAPRSHMRSTYATVLGAVPPADAAARRTGGTSQYRSQVARDARAASRNDDDRAAGAGPGGCSPALPLSVTRPRETRDGVWRSRHCDDGDGAACSPRRVSATRFAPADDRRCRRERHRARVRVTVEDLERTTRLYRDAFGVPFTEMGLTSAAFRNLIGENGGAAKVRAAAATLPARDAVEFLQVTRRRVVIASRHASRIRRGAAATDGPQHPRVDVGAAQRRPSTVASNGIITQPHYRSRSCPI